MNPMNRRDFFRHCTGLILSAGFLKNISISPLSSQFNSSTAAPSELLVVRNGNPRTMLLALFDALGGIESFITPGQRVVIKANFSFKRPPDQSATTNPQLIASLVSECIRAGAREVIVLDHTIENERMCMDLTGMREAVEGAGGTIKAINSSRDYTEIDIPGGKRLKKTYFSKDVLDADVFINVPIAKNHVSTVTTLSMKNLMGIVYDRGELHQKGLHQCIADLNTFRTPDLIILDAYRILMTRGPGGPGEIKEAGEIIAGFDPVAIDTYGSLLLEKDPGDIGYIQAAVDLDIGSMDFSTRIITCSTGPQQEIPDDQVPEEQETPAEPKPEIKQEAQTESLTPMPQPSETATLPEPTEEKGHTIPILLLIPVLIVAFLIGIRMRKSPTPSSREDEKST
jgi:uncharacterized protein (DUF362 family)